MEIIMSLSFFSNLEVADLIPVIVRLAVIIIAAEVIIDFFKRRATVALVDAIKSLGANTPETAVSAEQLENVLPDAKKKCRMLLTGKTSLSGYVLCADDAENPEKKYVKYTGTERWYIPEAENLKEEGIDAVKGAYIPAALREGAEKSLAKIIIGLVFLVVIGELFIYFYPQISEFVSNGFGQLLGTKN